MNTSIALKVTASNMITIVTVIVVVIIFLLAGTFVFNTAHAYLPHLLKIVVRETDLASENVFAAWYSSMLLLLSAVASLVCFLIDQQKTQEKGSRLLNYGWLIYASAFALLSFDELGSIHEHIGNFTAFKKAGNLVSGGQDSGWTFFYIIVGAVGLFMLGFSIVKLKKVKWALPLLICGLLLYLSNPFQEYFEIETMRSSVSDETWKRPVHLLLIEEGSELFGSLFFLVSLILYVIQTSKTNDLVINQEIKISTLKRFIGFLMLSMAVGFLLIREVFGDVAGDEETGVPKNWITASATFLTAVYFFILHYKESSGKHLLLFSVFSLCLSVYFGSNRFAYHFDADYSPSRLLLRFVFCAFGFLSFALLSRALQTRMTKWGTILAFAIVAIGIFARRPLSAEIIFAGFCCLLIVFLADRLAWKVK